MEEIKKLNLGCGQFPKEGYVNLDINPNAKADVFHDLTKFPYPFDDNSFSLIEVDHVLEHLEDTVKVMKELHRILKIEGRLIIKVPHFSRGFTNPEHKMGFDVSFPYWFSPKFKPWYVGVDFVLKKMRLRWFTQPHLKKTILPFYIYFLGLITGFILDFLANLSPFFCSRGWVFIVGGFEEIEFYFIKQK